MDNMIQSSTCQTAYTYPVAFLPATSLLPQASTAASDCPLDSTFLQTVVAMATQMKVCWQQLAVNPAWVACDLAMLAQQINRVAVHLYATCDPFRQLSSNCESQHCAPEELVQCDLNAVMVEACAIYDRYFQVERVAAMRFDAFVGQVAASACNLLDDLPYTLLDRGQIAQIVVTIGTMFATLQAKLPSTNNAVPATLTTEPPAPTSPYHTAWQQASAQTSAWTEQVAFYRWRVGHHFFDLCAIFCTAALQAAEGAIRAAEMATAVDCLQQAETFLRGTTAAMWYASDFSPQIYQQIIRPSMIVSGAPAGFSGDQNADYHCLKQAKQQLKKLVRGCYGNDLATMPALLRHAWLRFHEADIENDEHHLLIAAHKVGVDQSLAQKEWQAELPNLAYKQTALDVLREMAERRRREFAHER